MKATLKKVFIMMFTALVLFSLALPCFAVTQGGKITVTLEDNQTRIDDIKINICQIAKLNDTGYFPTKAFEHSGISISGIVNKPNENTAKVVADYIKNQQIDVLSLTTKNGTVSFSSLGLGIWIVFPEENGKYTFNPYIVFLPFEANGKLIYEISSTPKLEDNTPNEINIYVIKKWDDKNNASKMRPDFVTIELLNGTDVVETVKLSEENGWAHTFRKIPKGDNYSVREKPIENYKVDYSGDMANGFVVTNTYNGEKLPQTGQHWWPIVIIAIAGACFVVLGIFELRSKNNGKEK